MGNINGNDITVSQFPWLLAYTAGTSIQITGSVGGDMPKPEYPMDQTVKPGRYVAGLRYGRPLHPRTGPAIQVSG